jgi:hypothetical protein
MGRGGDLEPVVGLAVRVRVFGADVRVCARPDWAERPGRLVGGKAMRDGDVPNKRFDRA